MLRSNISENEKLVIIEPYYSGAITLDILEALVDKNVHLHHIGVPREFLTNYGTKEEHDEKLGLNATSIRQKLSNLIHT